MPGIGHAVPEASTTEYRSAALETVNVYGPLSDPAPEMALYLNVHNAGPRAYAPSDAGRFRIHRDGLGSIGRILESFPRAGGKAGL